MNQSLLSRLMVIVALGCAFQSGAQQPASPAPTKIWQPITSHQHNFIVTDLPSRNALEIAVWAESVREKMEDWLEMPVPTKNVYPMVLSARTDTDDVRGRVLKAQDFTQDGFLRQEITMINFEAMDQEDVLEAICWLLLNRYIHLRQETAERIIQPGSFPDWFAVGVAQNLYPDMRIRNGRDVLAHEQNGNYKPVSMVFDQVYLPPGRWPDKARAGLTVAWLAEVLTPRIMVEACSARLAAGFTLDDEVMSRLLELPDRRTMNMAWDVWMARQDHRLVPGAMSSETIAFQQILELRPEEAGLVMPYRLPDGRLTVDDLIDARSESWVSDYSRNIALRLRREAIGKTPDLLACISFYAAFFEELASVATSEKAGASNDARTWKNKWEQLGREWENYQRQFSARQELLNRHASGDDLGDLRSMMNQWESK